MRSTIDHLPLLASHTAIFLAGVAITNLSSTSALIAKRLPSTYIAIPIKIDNLLQNEIPQLEAGDLLIQIEKTGNQECAKKDINIKLLQTAPFPVIGIPKNKVEDHRQFINTAKLKNILLAKKDEEAPFEKCDNSDRIRYE